MKSKIILFALAFASLVNLHAGTVMKDLTLTGNPTVPVGATLTINGTLSGGGVGTVTSVTLTQPSAGFTISNSGSAITSSGTRTFSLANDLLGLEGLSSTGFAVRTATDTWAQRSIAGTSDKITITNGDGVSGNPTITIASTYAGQSTITTVGTLTSGSIGSGFTAIGLDHLAAGGATNGQLMKFNGSNWVPATIATGGDMLKTTYDPQNLGYISGAMDALSLGATGGYLKMDSGNSATADNGTGAEIATGGNGGYIEMLGANAAAAVALDGIVILKGFGGSAGAIITSGTEGTVNVPGNTFTNGGNGGGIFTYADGPFNGGNIVMNSNGTNSAGSINTQAGGSLTMGTGNLSGGNVTGTILTTAGSGASLTGVVHTADTGTVTSTMIANGTIVAADISSSAAITNSQLANSAMTIAGTSVSLGGSISADTISGGIASNGLLARTAANTRAARTITAGTGISVTNGDGVSGNPTVALSLVAGTDYAVPATLATLTSDQTTTNTSLADVTGLTFSVAANKNYVFRFECGYTTSASGEGCTFSINGPASPTQITYIVETFPDATGSGASRANFVTGSYDSTAPAKSTGPGATVATFRVYGVIKTGATAGTLSLRYASETGGANSTTVKSGSFGMLTPLP